MPLTDSWFPVFATYLADFVIKFILLKIWYFYSLSQDQNLMSVNFIFFRRIAFDRTGSWVFLLFDIEYFNSLMQCYYMFVIICMLLYVCLLTLYYTSIMSLPFLFVFVIIHFLIFRTCILSCVIVYRYVAFCHRYVNSYMTFYWCYIVISKIHHFILYTYVLLYIIYYIICTYHAIPQTCHVMF